MTGSKAQSGEVWLGRDGNCPSPSNQIYLIQLEPPYPHICKQTVAKTPNRATMPPKEERSCSLKKMKHIVVRWRNDMRNLFSLGFCLFLAIVALLASFFVLWIGAVPCNAETLLITSNTRGQTTLVCPDGGVDFTFSMAMWSDVNSGESGQVYALGSNAVTLDDLTYGGIYTARVRLLDANAAPVKECKLTAAETYFTAGFDPNQPFAEQPPKYASIGSGFRTCFAVLNALDRDVEGAIVCGGYRREVLVPAGGAAVGEAEAWFPDIDGGTACRVEGDGLSIVSMVQSDNGYSAH